MSTIALHASVGAELTQYHIDVDAVTPTKVGTIIAVRRRRRHSPA
jgi:hypothetical protein